MKVKKIAVIGGDTRNLKLAEMLSDDGFNVNTFAIGKNDSATLELALKGSDLIIGPLPFSVDGKTLNTPLYKDSIPINLFLKTAGENAVVLAGKFDDNINLQARYYLVKTIDILEREDFIVLNAIPTAEGAIQIAMQETPYTLNSSNILVLGFGRIGDMLLRMLSGMGANIAITARSFKDMAYAKAYGIRLIQYCDLPKEISNMDIIFNTVPAMVLDENCLKNVMKSSIIIDLASKPGGVDFDKAKELSIKTIWALSLPGKVAPQTSARIIRDTAFNVISEMGG